MKRVVKKIILIIAGCVAGLIIVELTLNLAGSMCSRAFQEKKQDLSQYSEGVCRIICIGDSWTFGMGAVIKKNYPQQLQEILNKSKAKYKFKVYNLGYPNFTAAMAIEKFKKLYPELDPHIVIAMIGRSNEWNFTEYYDKGSILKKVKRGFLNTKIAKLINIALYNAQYNLAEKNKKDRSINKGLLQSVGPWINKGNKYREKRRFAEAYVCYESALDLTPGSISALLEIGRCYKIEGKYDQAFDVLSQAFIIDMSNNEVCKELSAVFICLDSPQKEVDFYYFLSKKFPRSKYLQTRLVGAYIVLADNLFMDKQVDEAVSIYDKALKLDPENEKLYTSIIYNQAIINKGDSFLSKRIKSQQNKRSLKVRSNAQFSKNKTLTANLHELVNICKKQEIKLILSGYPGQMLKSVQQVAAEYKIPLIDHRQSFEQSEDDLFSQDGHCNNKGYKLVAENISQQIYILIKQINSLE